MKKGEPLNTLDCTCPGGKQGIVQTQNKGWDQVLGEFLFGGHEEINAA